MVVGESVRVSPCEAGVMLKAGEGCVLIQDGLAALPELWWLN
jgi:hypothetical protein